MEKELIAFSPQGFVICGTADTVPATALISGNWSRNEDGSLAFDWEGETKVHWDDQRTNLNSGERVFVDTEGNECRESEVILADLDSPAAVDDLIVRCLGWFSARMHRSFYLRARNHIALEGFTEN